MVKKQCPRCGSSDVDEQGVETNGPAGWQGDGTWRCDSCGYVWDPAGTPPPPPRPTTASDPGHQIREGSDGFALACALIAGFIGVSLLVAAGFGFLDRPRPTTVAVPLSEVIKAPRAYAGRGVGFLHDRDRGVCLAVWLRFGEANVARIPCAAVPDDLLKEWR